MAPCLTPFKTEKGKENTPFHNTRTCWSAGRYTYLKAIEESVMEGFYPIATETAYRIRHDRMPWRHPEKHSLQNYYYLHKKK